MGSTQSAHLYVYFKSLLESLYTSSKWRTRLESLAVLEKVIEQFGVDETMVDRLRCLIVGDKAHRVRMGILQLVRKFMGHQLIRERLVPLVLEESRSGDYLHRMMVLHLIEVPQLIA